MVIAIKESGVSSDTTSFRTIAVIVILACMVFGYRLGAKDFWASPEARAAIIGRKIISSGNWFPHSTTEGSFFREPPLHHWMVALGMSISGVESEVMARVPSFLAATLTIVFVYLIGRTIKNEWLGRVAAATTGLSAMFAWYARIAEVDMLFGFWITLSFWALFRAMQGSSWSFLVFHFAVALSVITKGMAGPVLIYSSLLLFVLWQRNARVFNVSTFWMGGLLSALLIAGWATILFSHVPALAENLLFRGYIGALGHREGFTFYFLRLPLGFLPLTFVLPWSLCLPWRTTYHDPDKGRVDPWAIRLSFCWFAVPFVLFSVWPSKQTHHLIPIIPPLALLTATALIARPSTQGFWSVDLKVYFSRLGTILIPTVCAIAAPILSLQGYSDSAWMLFGTACVMTIISLGARVVPAWRQRIGTQVALFEFVVLLMVLLGHLVPRINMEESHKPFLFTVQRMVPPSQPLAGLNLKSQDLYYLDRPVKSVRSSDGLRTQKEQSSYVIVSQKKLRTWPKKSYVSLLRSDDVSRNQDLELVQLKNWK